MQIEKKQEQFAALKMFRRDLRHSTGLFTEMEKPCLWQLAKDFLLVRELFIIVLFVGDCVWCVFGGYKSTHIIAHLWRPEDNTLELVLSAFLHWAISSTSTPTRSLSLRVTVHI